MCDTTKVYALENQSSGGPPNKLSAKSAERELGAFEALAGVTARVPRVLGVARDLARAVAAARPCVAMAGTPGPKKRGRES